MIAEILYDLSLVFEHKDHEKPAQSEVAKFSLASG